MEIQQPNAGLFRQSYAPYAVPRRVELLQLGQLKATEVELSEKVVADIEDLELAAPARGSWENNLRELVERQIQLLWLPHVLQEITVAQLSVFIVLNSRKLVTFKQLYLPPSLRLLILLTKALLYLQLAQVLLRVQFPLVHEEVLLVVFDGSNLAQLGQLLL